MKLEALLLQRSENNCELCKSSEGVKLYEVLPQKSTSEENCMMVCATCLAQIEKKAELNSSHWQCLTESMWSEVPGIQVVAWRMLNRLKSESWATDNLDMLYLDDEKLAWAKALGDHDNDSAVELHKDSNGTVLQTGDTVVLTKSLDVKGSTSAATINVTNTGTSTSTTTGALVVAGGVGIAGNVNICNFVAK